MDADDKRLVQWEGVGSMQTTGEHVFYGWPPR